MPVLIYETETDARAAKRAIVKLARNGRPDLTPWISTHEDGRVCLHCAWSSAEALASHEPDLMLQAIDRRASMETDVVGPDTRWRLDELERVAHAEAHVRRGGDPDDYGEDDLGGWRVVR